VTSSYSEKFGFVIISTNTGAICVRIKQCYIVSQISQTITNYELVVV